MSVCKRCSSVLPRAILWLRQNPKPCNTVWLKQGQVRNSLLSISGRVSQISHRNGNPGCRPRRAHCHPAWNQISGRAALIRCTWIHPRSFQWPLHTSRARANRQETVRLDQTQPWKLSFCKQMRRSDQWLGHRSLIYPKRSKSGKPISIPRVAWKPLRKMSKDPGL